MPTTGEALTRFRTSRHTSGLPRSRRAAWARPSKRRWTWGHPPPAPPHYGATAASIPIVGWCPPS